MIVRSAPTGSPCRLISCRTRRTDDVRHHRHDEGAEHELDKRRSRGLRRLAESRMIFS